MTPGADRRHLIVVTTDRAWPAAAVVATDAHAGRRYRCPCGWEGWTCFGHASRHRRTCATALSGRVDVILEERAALRFALESIAAGDGRAAALAHAALSRWPG